MDVLNKGLRPHLTRWQAGFRSWYRTEAEKEANRLLPPQQLQKRYPEYEQLIAEMTVVNEHLVTYRENLRKIAFGA